MRTHREAVEGHYRAWLLAARSAAGSSQALNSLVASYLSHRSRNIDARIRGWTNPATLKLPASQSSDEINALAQAIMHFAPKAPATKLEVSSLEDLIREIIRLRHDSQVHGVKLSSSADALYKDEVLGMPVTTVKELDSIRLNLGSAIFHGELPPYTDREIDNEILSAINEPSSDLIAIVGPPKVGKTRTLVENLKRSNLSQSNVFWLRPGADFSSIISALKPSDKSSTVVVIDDLQRWGHELQKLTSKQLVELRSRAKVLVTLHTADLLKWRVSKYEHSSSLNLSSQIVPSTGPSSAVVDEIERCSFRLASTLSEPELNLASQNTPDLPREKLINLGAYFSSLEYLLRTMEALAQSDDPFTEALVEAIIDSRILHPNGITVENLESLTEFELQSLSPNLFFSRAKFEIMLSEVFTRGASTDSPHSILQRTPDNPKTYSLFESLWDGIKPKEWRAPISLIKPSTALALAENIASAGYFKQVIDVLEKFPESENGDYCLQMALAHSELRDEENEAKWYQRGVDHGHAQSMFHYAFALEGRDVKGAINLYQQAADLGDTDSMFNLALLVRSEEPDRARSLYEAAANAGLREAMNNLAQMIELSEPAKAAELYKKSSDLGNELATYNLAIHLSKIDPEKAIELYRLNAQAGDPESMNNLAVMIWDQDPDESEKLLREAAALGNSRAMFNLAKMLEDFDAEESKQFLSQAAVCHYAPAIYVQGLNLRDEGFWDEAIRKFEEAAELGDAPSMFELGKMLDESDHTKAIEMLRQAALHGETKAKVNLAFELEEENLTEALRLYKEASHEGDPRAKANLARLLEEDEPDLARTLLEESVSMGDPYGCYLLAHKSIDADAELAKNLFEKALKDDQPGAWHGLGVCWEKTNFDTAITCYQNAVDIDEDDRAAFRLGELFEGQDNQKAIEYFSKASEFGNSEAPSRKAQLQARLIGQNKTRVSQSAKKEIEPSKSPAKKTATKGSIDPPAKKKSGKTKS